MTAIAHGGSIPMQETGLFNNGIIEQSDRDSSFYSKRSVK